MGLNQHYDVVGSFLRPQVLKDAREASAAGKISADGLRRVEDGSIRELIEKQIEAGLPFVTDGEFRRALWHTDFFWGLGGVERALLNEGYKFVGLETRSDTAKVVGKISGENHPFVRHFEFVRDAAGSRAIPKQTIPAPAQFIAEVLRPENHETTTDVYPDLDELKADIVQAYGTVIRELYDAGCRYIQLDDCTWGGYVDKDFLAQLKLTDEAVDQVLQSNLELNNAVIKDAPSDLTIATHICRGNYRSHHAFQGAYDRVAPYVLKQEPVQAFYLEFDDDRSGGFESLSQVHPEADVVLGLITSKNPELEDADRISERVREASRYVPLERLSLSPQCGFASTEEGNALSEEQQWEKIRLVREVAEKIWNSGQNQ